MDMSKLSDEDLAAVAAGNMGKVSDEGLQHIASQPNPGMGQAQTPQAAPQSDIMASKQELQDWAGKQSQRSMLDRLINPQEMPQKGVNPMAWQQGVAPPTAEGAAIGSKLMGNFAGRIGTNAAMGAAKGAIDTPADGQTREGNAVSGAVTNGLVSGGVEALGGLGQLAGKASKWAGGKLAGLSPSEASSYAKDPALAEKLATMNREDPMGLSDMVRQQVKGGLDEAFDSVSKPALEKVGQAVAGKQVRVNPAQYDGTAAGQELDRAWNTKGNTIDVPVYQRTRAAQVNTQVPPSTPTTQTAEIPPRASYYSDASSGDKIQVPVQEPPKEEWAPQQQLEDILTKQPTQQAPAPKPDAFWVSGPQALTAKRASQDAANHTRALNPIAYNPADDAEAGAASNLRKAIEGVAPETKDLNDTLAESSRYAAHAKATMGNNPAAILTDSEGVGSVPTRSMRQFLDSKSGTQLESLAQALKAGRAASDPDRTHGLFDALLAKPAGRAALRTSSKLPQSNADAGSIAAILNQLRSSAK